MAAHAASFTPIALSLRQRVFRAGFWTVGGFGIGQAIRFGSNLVMTRLLVPEMFGVMAIATLLMYGLAMFSDVGLRQSVVQSRRGDDPAFINTAWTFQILRGFLIFLFGLLVSLALVLVNSWGMTPPGSVYANPILPAVVAALSAGAAITGFESGKLLQASRQLSLARLTQLEIVSQVAGLVCMILWAMVDRSIWALVAGSLCWALTRSTLSHVLLTGTRNRLQWDRTAHREILHFGRWIFLSSILGFLVNSGDRMLLGGLVSASVLGVYSIAYLLANAVETVLSKLIADISFPALSEVVRDRPADLKATYYRFHVAIAAFSYACVGFLVVSGHSIVAMLYDHRYTDAGWMLEVLSVALLTIPFRTATQCFQALGMPHLLFRIIAIRLVALFVLTPVGFHLLGMPGALWGIVLSQVSTLPPTIFYKIKYGLFNLRKELLLLSFVPAGLLLGEIFKAIFLHD